MVSRIEFSMFDLSPGIKPRYVFKRFRRGMSAKIAGTDSKFGRPNISQKRQLQSSLAFTAIPSRQFRDTGRYSPGAEQILTSPLVASYADHSARSKHEASDDSARDRLSFLVPGAGRFQAGQLQRPRLRVPTDSCGPAGL